MNYSNSILIFENIVRKGIKGERGMPGEPGALGQKVRFQ